MSLVAKSSSVSRLTETAQAEGWPLPNITGVQISTQSFTSMTWPGSPMTGTSIKDARHAAAADALNNLNVARHPNRTPLAQLHEVRLGMATMRQPALLCLSHLHCIHYAAGGPASWVEAARLRGQVALSAIRSEGAKEVG